MTRRYEIVATRARGGACLIKTPESEILGPNMPREIAEMATKCLNGEQDMSVLLEWFDTPEGTELGTGLSEHLVRLGATVAVEAEAEARSEPNSPWDDPNFSLRDLQRQ